MITNKNLLKTKLTESLNEVNYSFDINDKVDAIVESLNMYDDDKSWTSKLNRDVIRTMITNSNDINNLVESICNTVCKSTDKKKLTESKKPLREGPGAGYSVKGSVSSLRDIKILDTKSEANRYGENEITVTATANCDIENVSASSYYYGRAIVDGAAIPATIELNFTYWESEFKGESPEQVVKYYNEFEFDCGLGGGWSHSTFTGEISGDYNDVEKDPYGCDTNTFTITIQNERVIKDIDLAVTGEDWQDEYVVEYDDGTEEYFETKEEAIADAEKNRGISVTHRQWQWALMSDFESEDAIDEYSEGVIWERDYDKQYKYDEEDVEEAFAKRDVYVNDEYKFSSNNYKTNKELLNKIRQDRKVKYAGQKAIATAGTQLDEIEIKPEDKVKVRKSKRESLDDKVTYVIYKENDKFKGTPKSNYDAQVRNANMVQDFSKFNDANQIIDYLTKYTSNKDKSQYKVVDECAKQVTENVHNTSENNIRQKLQSIQDKISSWTSARGIVVTDLAEYDGTPETMTEGEASDFIRSTLNKSLYEMNDKLQEVIDIEDETIYDEFDDLAKVVKKAKDLMEDNLTEQTYKKISKDLFDPFFKLNESTNKKVCRNCFKESVIDKSKLFSSKKKNVKESLDGETYSKVLDAFPNLNVAYDDEEPFFIVDSWDEAIELQKFLAPDYEPKSDTDTRKLDEILNDKWGFSDMFTACYGCGELIDFGSSSPDDYGIVENDGIYCEACIKQNPDDYLDNLINNPKRANTCLDQSDFESKGFEVVGDNFENGLYGRADSPDKILKDLLTKYPDGEFVFDAKHGRSPYAVNFQVFGRNLGNDNEPDNDDTDESLKENKSNKLGFFVLNNEIDENQLKDLGLEYDNVRGNYLVKGTPGDLVKLAKTLGMDATEEELINAADSQFSRVRSVNESINEKWIQFKFEDGSNPYIAKTKEEQDRMFKKYKDRVEQVSDITYLVKNKNLKESSLDQYVLETRDGIYKENGKIKLFDTDADAMNFADRNGLKDAIARLADEDDINENLKEDVQKLNAKVYYEEDGEPIIVFKSIGDRKGNFDAYVHNGQHTVAAPDYVKTLKKANLNDQKVKDLIAEYESNYPVKLNLKESKKDWIRVKQDGAWYIVDDSNGKEIDGPFETLKETEDAGYGHLEYIAPRTDENLNERVAKYSNKPDKLTASEFFDTFDFTIYKTQNEDGEEIYKLRDNQGANLGDIEDDELDLIGAVDRLDPMYYDDYILRPLEEETYELNQKDSKYDNLYSLLHHNHSYEEILDELIRLNDDELNAYITLIYYIVHPDELVDDVLTEEELFENLLEKKDKYKVLQGNWGYGWDDIDEIKLTDDKEENIKNSNELAKKVMVSKETKPANKYRMKIKKRKSQENINESDDFDAQYSVKYWEDETLRDQGFADYYGRYSDLDEAKDVCDWLVKKGYAVSAEVVDKDDSTLYGSYPEDESLKEYGSIMSYLDDKE